MEYVILALLAIVSVVQVFTLKLILPEKVGEVADEHETNVNEHLTAYELERLEKEDSFDKRISQIKDELAMQQSIIKSSGISADELHPLVKNLPHNIIAEKHSEIPDVEYAE